MKKFIVLILLLVGSWCWGETYYVATDGNDTTGDGSVAAKWKTIQKAVTDGVDPVTINIADGTYTESAANKLSFSGNTKTYTLVGASKAGTIIRPSGATAVEVTGASLTISMSNLTIQDSHATAANLVYVTSAATGTTTLTLTNCVLGTASATGEVPAKLPFRSEDAGVVASLVDCTLYARVRNGVYLNPCTSFYASGCVINVSSTTAGDGVCTALGTITSVVFDHCTAISNQLGFHFDATTRISTLQLSNSNWTTASSPFNILGVVMPAVGVTADKIYCFANTLNHNDDNGDGGHSESNHTICIGDDGAINNTPSTIQIRDNVINRTNPLISAGLSAHGLIVCPNTVGAVITGNKIYGAPYGLIIKGKFHIVEDNLVVQYNTSQDVSNGMYLKGAYGCVVRNNTIIGQSTGGVACCALKIMEQNVITTLNGYNVIEDNIFDGGQTNYSVWMETSYETNKMNRNCYVSGTSGMFYVDDYAGNHIVATIPLLQDWWSTHITSQINDLKLNDANSISETVNFVNAAGDDYRPKNANLKLTDGTWIGAEAPPKSVGWIKNF